MKYLLPCSCGLSILVDVGQAGQMVTCSCGTTQEAPTMRSIRALPPAEEVNAQQAAERKPAAWSPLQGGLFAAGIVLALVGLTAAGVFGNRLRLIDIPVPTEADFIRDANQLDRMPVDEAYESYLAVREMGLTVQQVPLYARAQRVEALYVKYVIAGAVAAAVGIAMVVAAFVIRPR